MSAGKTIRKRLPTLVLLAVIPVMGPHAHADASFRMQIADAFKITGRGTVVTGQIVGGSVRSGDEVCLHLAKGGSRMVTILGIERFNKILEEAREGDAVGLLIGDVAKDDITLNSDSLSAQCD